MKQHIFISHANEDKLRIRPILDALLENGFTLWLDNPRSLSLHNHDNVRGIKSFESWEGSIRKGVETAGAVIVFWSRSAVLEGRDELHEEARTAKRQRRLIQVAIDPLFRLGATLPWGFSERQLLDLSEELDAFHTGRSRVLDLSDLIKDVAEFLNTRALNDVRSNTFVAPAGFAPVGSAAPAFDTSTADDPVPYLVDREPQQLDFVASVCRELKRGGSARPSVFLLPGPPDQRPDKFVDILQHEVLDELRYDGNLGHQFDWSIRRLHWPCCGAELTREIDSRHLPHCLSALGAALLVGGADLAMSNREAFAQHVAKALQDEPRRSVLIHTRVEAGSSWSPLDQELLKKFFAWWQTVPLSAIRTRPILLLSLVGSAEQPRGALRFLRQHANVYSFIDALDPKQFPGLNVVRLRRLEGIMQRHVATWAETVFESRRAPKVAHAALVREAARYLLKDNEVRPLEWVGDRLSAILKRPDVAAQYVRH